MKLDHIITVIHSVCSLYKCSYSSKCPNSLSKELFSTCTADCNISLILFLSLFFSVFFFMSTWQKNAWNVSDRRASSVSSSTSLWELGVRVRGLALKSWLFTVFGEIMGFFPYKEVHATAWPASLILLSLWKEIHRERKRQKWRQRDRKTVSDSDRGKEIKEERQAGGWSEREWDRRREAAIVSGHSKRSHFQLSLALID